MSSDRIILVTGATGRQGGAVLRSLAGKGFRLLGMTRKPESGPARTLASQGVNIVKADFDDAASLSAALEGVWGALSVQPRDAGPAREEERGLRFARSARAAGVQHFVYHSVASADRRTGIPHFESKARIEDTVRSLCFPSHVIVRPAFFMENLRAPSFLSGGTLTAAIKPTTRLQMIAVRDIGEYGARAFLEADRLNRREIDIAGDAVTMSEAATTLSAALGRPIEFVQAPIAEVRTLSPAYATMLEWFDRVGYDIDIPALVREFGLQPTTLAAWSRMAPVVH